MDKRRAKVIKLERQAAQVSDPAPWWMGGDRDAVLERFDALTLHEKIDVLKAVNARRFAMEKELRITPTQSQEIRRQLQMERLGR